MQEWTRQLCYITGSVDKKSTTYLVRPQYRRRLQINFKIRVNGIVSKVILCQKGMLQKNATFLQVFHPVLFNFKGHDLECRNESWVSYSVKFETCILFAWSRKQNSISLHLRRSTAM